MAFLLVLLSLWDAPMDGLAGQLLRTQRGGFDEESAAFIVRNSAGGLELYHWPRSRAFRAAHWDGALPEGVVALMHTHPASLPRPSGQDVAEARRLRLPVYVVTERQMCVADAKGIVQCGERVNLRAAAAGVTAEGLN